MHFVGLFGGPDMLHFVSVNLNNLMIQETLFRFFAAYLFP